MDFTDIEPITIYLQKYLNTITTIDDAEKDMLMLMCERLHRCMLNNNIKEPHIEYKYNKNIGMFNISGPTIVELSL